jgi:hypothetical protein
MQRHLEKLDSWDESNHIDRNVKHEYEGDDDVCTFIYRYVEVYELTSDACWRMSLWRIKNSRRSIMDRYWNAIMMHQCKHVRQSFDHEIRFDNHIVHADGCVPSQRRCAKREKWSRQCFSGPRGRKLESDIQYDRDHLYVWFAHVCMCYFVRVIIDCDKDDRHSDIPCVYWGAIVAGFTLNHTSRRSWNAAWTPYDNDHHDTNRGKKTSWSIIRIMS